MDENEVAVSAQPASTVEGERSTTEGSSSAPTSRLKMEDSDSDSTGDRAGSPDTNCAICLGKLKNTSFTDSCLHPFCFNCLREWSKVKPECPLCKQSFKSIIHNVRSIEDYDQYYLRPVAPPPEMVPRRISVRNLSFLVDTNQYIDRTSNSSSNPPRSFRYRTTMTSSSDPVYNYLQTWDSIMTRSMMDHIAIPPRRPPRRTRSYTHRNNISIVEVSVGIVGSNQDRRSIYNRNLWVRRVPDVTGRFRECSPEFFVNNPAQVHRLVPWLNRELNALLAETGQSTDDVLGGIIGLITRHHIRSRVFRDFIHTYLGARTDHFIHEFYSFGSSPYDMIGYDNNMSYGPPFSVAHEPYEDDNIDSSDSDIQIIDEVSTSTTSRSRNVPSSQNILDLSVAGPSRASDELIAISSGADSELEECQIVGTVKPRHLRTPEIITLGDSDNSGADSEPEAREVKEERKFQPGRAAQSSWWCRMPMTAEEEAADRMRRNPFFTRPVEPAATDTRAPLSLDSASSSDSGASSKRECKASRKRSKRSASSPRKKRKKSSSCSSSHKKKSKESRKRSSKDKKKPIRHWKKKLCQRRVDSSSSSDEESWKSSVTFHFF